MAFNGSGVFVRLYSWVSDKANGILINASRMDNEMNGFATGLSDCVTRDGQSPATANLPMGGFVHTNVGNATASNQYATAGQVQNQSFTWCGTAGGTANAATLSPSPSIAAYAAGQRFYFLPSANNTAAVTAANSGMSTRSVLKSIGGALVALAPNDLISAVPAYIVDDGTEYVLLNPFPHAHGADIASASTVVLDAATGDLVDITGTTTITAITLAEGRQVTARFAGILTLTNGANLVLPGGANITTATGDYAVFRGYASGVVRVTYSKASGSPVAVASSFPDNTFFVTDDGDATKKLAFQCSGITTGTTRTVTIPDKNGTIAMLSDLPLTKSFTSSDQTITSSGSLTLAHGLIATPTNFQLFLVCQSSEIGYSTGNIVPIFQNGLGSNGVALTVDATNIHIRYASSASAFNLLDFSTGSSANPTNANWKLRVLAWV